ncbi:MAG: sulfatase-like hydrolase/transferase [Limisphaerales bacterium]
MKTRSIITALLFAALATVQAAERKPNIIVLLIDDMGYECIGANGCTSYKTPAIDRLAATGVRFEHCNVQPLCTPTRVQMMTGVYNVRNYTDFGEMDPKSVTFANLLKPAGYATCISGKWQLGTNVNLPKQFGFDEHCLWQHTRAGAGKAPGRYMNPGLEINGVAKDFTNQEYGPDIVSDYALDFIQRKKDQPFFLYYTMMLTHAPFQPTPDSPGYGKKSGGKAPARADGINQNFADMVAYTDKLTGKLVARLDQLGIRDNTLLIILGDNGTQRGTLTMMGDRKFIGGKGAPTDAGMHVPLIVNWPAKAAAGRVSRDLVDSTDFLPTVCEAAGVAVPAGLKIDGRSFLPQVRGEPGTPRDWYYSWYAPKKDDGIIAEFAANRNFKLSRTGAFYDLRKDIEEKNPLKVAALNGEAAAAAKVLQGALDQYKDARPAAIALPFLGPKVKGDGRHGKGKAAADAKTRAIKGANKKDENK